MVTEKNFFRSGFLEFDDLPKVISMTLSYKVVKGANKKNFPTHNNNNSEYYLTCRLSLQVEILRFRAHYKASSSYAQCVKYSPPPPAAFERRENVASPLSPRHAKKKRKKVAWQHLISAEERGGGKGGGGKGKEEGFFPGNN